jgi:acyl-coenzyme A thioesterase PaaI-like protein
MKARELIRERRLPTWSELITDARTMRLGLNVWPPLRFAGVRVEHIADDFSEAVVVLKLGLTTRNYVGTQFGGSLFAMVDPFWVLLVMNQLGPDYVVWDRAAQIEFVRPGRTDVRAHLRVNPAFVEQLRAAAADGSKVLRWVDTDIHDRQGQLVARVRRQLYVRRKPTGQRATSR